MIVKKEYESDDYDNDDDDGHFRNIFTGCPHGFCVLSNAVLSVN